MDEIGETWNTERAVGNLCGSHPVREAPDPAKDEPSVRREEAEFPIERQQLDRSGVGGA